MHKRSRIRLANGIVSAIIVCFFLAHAILGSITGLVTLPNALAFLVWGGVAAIAIHVVLSVFTSREQLADPEHPASERKKRHLALKWATGILLITAASAHVACVQILGADTFQSTLTGSLTTVALITVLAVHIGVGMKSLVVDLGAGKQLIQPLRIGLVVLAIAIGVAALAAALL